MSKKMSVTIGGKELTLNFGVGRFYNIFKETTGFDLLDQAVDFSSVKMNEVVQGLVYAGYVAECKVNKKEPELTKEFLYDALLDEDTAKIYSDYAKIVNPKAAEELEEAGKQNGRLKESSIL